MHLTHSDGRWAQPLVRLTTIPIWRDDDKTSQKPRRKRCWRFETMWPLWKEKNLTKTDCCGQWICDDEDTYVLFSYARNSCSRNHRRFTLCAHHYAEGHTGDWQTCSACKNDFGTEMYVYYGTNEYNFEKLKNPLKFKPTRCAKCKKIIRLGEDGYSMQGGNYYCMECSSINW
jgi:hypothetical protein